MTEVTAHVNNASVRFVIDLKISGGTCKNQAEVDHAIGARDAFLKSLAQSIYSDANSEANSIAKQHYCDNFADIDVEMGSITTA